MRFTHLRKRDKEIKKRDREIQDDEKDYISKIWSMKRIGRADIITSYQMIWNGFEQLL